MSYKNKSGSQQCYETPGGIVQFAQGLSRDAGAETPPAPTEYGPPGTGKIPSAGNKGSNTRVISSYFSNGKKGGKT